jgi:hypothetical protein
LSANERDANESALSYLRRVLRLRIELIIVCLLLLSAGLYVLQYYASASRLTWVGSLPLAELANTALSTAMIAVIYEWLIRRDSSDQLNRTLVRMAETERPALSRAVVKTVISDDDLLAEFVAANNAERVLEAALVAAAGNRDLAVGLRRGLIRDSLATSDYWENYRARVYISDSTDLLDKGGALDTFFNFSVEIRYETILRKSVFRYAAATTSRAVRQIMADRAYDGCWLVAVAHPYTQLEPELFSLDWMRVGEVDMEIVGRQDSGLLVHSAQSSELGSMIGTRVEIEYRYRMKFDKRGHIFSFNVRYPTRRASYEIDYSQSSIVHFNVFDYFMSSAPIRMRAAKDAARPGTVEIEAPDWVFPAGGVAFSWVLKAEHGADFIERIGMRQE